MELLVAPDVVESAPMPTENPALQTSANGSPSACQGATERGKSKSKSDIYESSLYAYNFADSGFQDDVVCTGSCRRGGSQFRDLSCDEH